MTPDDALLSLRDIEGVYGSFFVDLKGAVVARDVPPVVGDAALAAAAPRIHRLWGVLPTADAATHITLEFASHGLFIRRFPHGSLCVFAPTSVNQSALQMAAVFAVDQLREATSPDHPQAAEPENTRSKEKRSFFYRGRRFFRE